MSEVNMEKAKEVYKTLCDMLDHKEWNYDKVEDDLVIKSGVKSDDFPIEFIMRVNPKNQLVSYLSCLPFKISEEKRIDAAIAVCVANYGMVDGSFDYDISDGSIIFRLTSSYRDSVLGEDLFEYMIMVAASTIDNYNDKFFMISKGMLSIEDFIKQENE